MEIKIPMTYIPNSIKVPIDLFWNYRKDTISSKWTVHIDPSYRLDTFKNFKVFINWVYFTPNDDYLMAIDKIKSICEQTNKHEIIQPNADVIIKHCEEFGIQDIRAIDAIIQFQSKSDVIKWKLMNG